MSFSIVEICAVSLLVGTGCIIYLERKFPYRRGIPFFREGFWTDLIGYGLIQSFFLKIVIFDYIIMPIESSVSLDSIPNIGQWPLFLQVLFFVITHDFYIYWFHRWQHANPILWRTHEAHHSNTSVDWIAGTRSHTVEILINQTIEFLPIFLLRADPAVVPIKGLIDGIWGMLIHANINFSFGKLKYILNGPEYHLWHHANHKEVFHANFGTKLSCWDALFGTLYDTKEKPKHWGLYYLFPSDYFRQHAYAFYRWFFVDLTEKNSHDQTLD